ncbi:hypothetical protein chiPu_0022361 [Chiloscyllium punctatum]|uniref:Uncharacterized protein n=1 Tax=Chiloscyllium punctatum TaxID=137246 RepID=A0A401RJQ9_CHIPU|nr:hypothetical protein [Chiloscyllium punctatum]
MVAGGGGGGVLAGPAYLTEAHERFTPPPPLPSPPRSGKPRSGPAHSAPIPASARGRLRRIPEKAEAS